MNIFSLNVKTVALLEIKHILIIPISWLFKSSCDPEKDFHENYMIHIMVLHGYAPGIFVETMSVEESFNM